MQRSPAVCCDVQGEVDIVSLPQSDLYLTKLDLYAPVSPVRSRRHEPRGPSTSSSPTSGGGNISRPAIHIHDSPVTARDRVDIRADDYGYNYAYGQDEAQIAVRDERRHIEQRDRQVYIQQRSAGQPLMACCGPPESTSRGEMEFGRYPGSGPSPTAPGMFDACCGPAGGKPSAHTITEERETVSIYVPRDSKRDPFLGERDVSQHGLQDSRQTTSNISCWENGSRETSPGRQDQPQRSTEDVFVPPNARPDPFLGSYTGSTAERRPAAASPAQQSPSRPRPVDGQGADVARREQGGAEAARDKRREDAKAKGPIHEDARPSPDRRPGESKPSPDRRPGESKPIPDRRPGDMKEDKTNLDKDRPAHSPQVRPGPDKAVTDPLAWEETRPSTAADRGREHEGRQQQRDIRDREQAVIGVREDYALPGVQEGRPRTNASACCGAAEDEGELVIVDLASPLRLRKKKTGPSFCGAPPNKDESYVLTFPDEAVAANLKVPEPAVIPLATNPVRHIAPATQADISDNSRHFRALQETGTTSRTIVAASCGSCGLNMSAMDRFTCHFDGTALFSEVFDPAHRALRESDKSWSSKSFMLLCPGRQPLHIRFHISADNCLISTVTAQLLDDTLRNTELECQHVIVDKRPKIDQIVMTDKYNVLPGKTPVAVKNAIGFKLDRSQLDQMREHCSLMIISATVWRPVGKVDNLVADFSKLYSSPEYYDVQSPIADVTLVCEREIFPATRAILMARSQVFYQMLRNKSRAVIAVTGTSPPVVKNMVDYIHTDKCEVLTHSDDVPMMVKVHELAVRFNVASLRDELALAICTRLTPANVELVRASAIKTRNAPLLASASVYANLR